MKLETREALLIVVIVFLCLALLKQLVKPEPVLPPQCSDYGYDKHTTVVMDTKLKLLKIQCVGNFNV